MDNFYTWILTPDLTDIDLDNLYNYGCYDDKCLISTFYIDEMLDFLDENNIKNLGYNFNNKYQYSIKFNLDNSAFNNVVDKLINFSTGRFKTSSIYIKKNNEWTKVWKHGEWFIVN